MLSITKRSKQVRSTKTETKQRTLEIAITILPFHIVALNENNKRNGWPSQRESI